MVVVVVVFRVFFGARSVAGCRLARGPASTRFSWRAEWGAHMGRPVSFSSKLAPKSAILQKRDAVRYMQVGRTMPSPSLT